MQQQEVEDDRPDSNDKGADYENNLHSALNPFVRSIRRNSHSICQTKQEMRWNTEIEQHAAEGKESLIGKQGANMVKILLPIEIPSRFR